MTKATVLIADNDQDFLEIVREYLRKKGYSVIVANSTLKARDTMQRGGIDVAVLDLRLTDDSDDRDFSGLALAASSCPEVPKVILTRYPNSGAVREALIPRANGSAAAFDFVTKQKGLPSLLAVVKRTLETAENGGLMEHLQEGKSEAWKRLWGTEAWRLVAVGRRYGLNDTDAMKVCLDTFLELAQAIKTLRRRRSLRAFLVEESLRRIRQLQNGSSKKPKAPPPKSASNEEEISEDMVAPAIEEKVSSGELTRQLTRALKVLPSIQREAITLHLFQGLSSSDIASEIGVSKTTARARLNDAFVKLQNELLKNRIPKEEKQG